MFDKERAEHFLNCLENDKPLVPPAGQPWSADDVLMLAGACHAAVLLPLLLAQKPALQGAHSELSEAVGMDSAELLHVAMNLVGKLTLAAKLGRFPGEPVRSIGISLDEVDGARFTGLEDILPVP